VAELLGQDSTLIQRVVWDGPNRLREISSARTFRGILRRVLDVVHRRCGHGTCFVPAHHCQGDHILAWSEGGLTTQDNGPPGCGPHNRWWYRTGHTHPPPDPAAEDDLDGLDDEAPGHGADGLDRRDPPRFMFRIRLPPSFDLRAGEGDEPCTIELHPLPHPSGRWRDHPIRLGTAA
jgi:hypothetical protein